MEHFFMKKKLTVLSILIAAVLVVSACTGMVSTALTANWHTSDIEYDPAFYEELTYDVAYNGDEATTTVYDMKDFKGTYVMKISAGEIYPTADGKTINELYKMETDLSLSGTFAQKGGKDVFAFSDLSVVSTVYFHRIGEGYNLQPVHSETKYLVYAPGQGSLNAVDVRIAKYDVVIDYNDSCSAAKYSKKDRSGELDVDIGKEKTVGNALPKFLLQSLGPLAMALGRDASVNFRIETLQIAHEVHIDRNRVLPVLEQKHELLDDVASRSHPRLIPAFLPVVKVLDTSPDQRLAVAEQLVDRPFGNAQPGCDVVHANRLDPVAYEQIGRFRYDPIF